MLFLSRGFFKSISGGTVMKKNTEAEQIRKEMAALSDEELGAVAGGFDTFPDQDGVDRHSWFVTLMMNLLHTHPNDTNHEQKERKP